MKKITLLVWVLLSVALVAEAQKEISKSFSGIKKVRVSLSSGNGSLKKSAGANVSVVLTYSYDDSFFKPSIEQEGEVLVIKERFEQGRNLSGNASWSLAIPDDVTISFATGSGNVEASGLKNEMSVTSGSGNLVFSNINGEVKGTTGSGNIDVDGYSGDFTAATGSGNVKVAGGSGDISISCGSGNIRLSSSQGAVSASTGSGDIEGRNVTLNGVSRFATGSGDIEVVLAASPKGNVSMASGSGKAELDFNGNTISGEIVMKTSKRNGSISAPFEFDKTEEIKEGNSDDVTIRKSVVKGSAANKISISTGSGDAVLKK